MKNSLKRGLYFISLLMLFVLKLNTCIFADDEEEKISNAVPKIKLANTSSISLIAGEKKTVSLKISNTGGSVARNILIQASPDSDAPIKTQILNNKNQISAISGFGSRDIKLDLIADDDAKSGNYNLNLKYFFTDDSDANHEGSDTITVIIKNKIHGP